MNTLKKGYKITFKMLLLAGYFILFASQFTCRYFSVANFYVYGAASANGNTAPGQLNNVQPGQTSLTKRVTHQANAQKPARFTVNTQRPFHLSIDKRFHFREGIRLPQVRAPGVPEYVLTTIRYYTHTPVYSSSGHPTIALRGPPCA